MIYDFTFLADLLLKHDNANVFMKKILAKINLEDEKKESILEKIEYFPWENYFRDVKKEIENVIDDLPKTVSFDKEKIPEKGIPSKSQGKERLGIKG